MLTVLDSTVLIDFLRGRPATRRVTALRAAGDFPATTAVNVEEIVRGLRPAEEAAADLLFAGLQVLPVTEHAARRAGTWRREFAAIGVTLTQADCLIAAAAVEHRGRLVTGNPSDFPMLGELVEHWPVGS